jgi:hypothetical protein
VRKNTILAEITVYMNSAFVSAPASPAERGPIYDGRDDLVDHPILSAPCHAWPHTHRRPPHSEEPHPPTDLTARHEESGQWALEKCDSASHSDPDISHATPYPIPSVLRPRRSVADQIHKNNIFFIFIPSQKSTFLSKSFS